MLLVGVGEERHHRVQRGVPAQVGDVVGVERQPRLGHEHRLGEHGQHQVADQESEHIAAPRHGMVGVNAQHAVQRLFDPMEQHVDPHRRAAHQSRQVQAQRPGQRDAGQQDDKGFGHGMLLRTTRVAGPRTADRRRRSAPPLRTTKKASRAWKPRYRDGLRQGRNITSMDGRGGAAQCEPDHPDQGRHRPPAGRKRSTPRTWQWRKNAIKIVGGCVAARVPSPSHPNGDACRAQPCCAGAFPARVRRD
ncbi:hypothetical protein D3C81_922860 [compost metagenome]